MLNREERRRRRRIIGREWITAEQPFKRDEKGGLLLSTELIRILCDVREEFLAETWRRLARVEAGEEESGYIFGPDDQARILATAYRRWATERGISLTLRDQLLRLPPSA